MTGKKILLRGLLGFPLGTFIASIIAIFISLSVGDGLFYSVDSTLIISMGTELNAFMLQFILSGVLGSAFAIGSTFFEIDSWSITKQTVSHFLLSAAVMLPIAYLCKWMDNSIEGFISYIVIFVIIYVIVWVIQYFFWKQKIKKLNEGLKK